MNTTGLVSRTIGFTGSSSQGCLHQRAQTLIPSCLRTGMRAALGAEAPWMRCPRSIPGPPRSPRQRRLRSPQRRARGRLRGGAGRILPPLSPLGAGPAPSPRLSPAGAAAAAGTGEAERSAERSAAGSGARKRGSAEGRKEEEEEKKQEEEEEEEQRQEGGSAGRAAPGAPLRARRGSAAAPRSRRDAPAALPQP